jgi:hypothetical protein
MRRSPPSEAARRRRERRRDPRPRGEGEGDGERRRDTRPRRGGTGGGGVEAGQVGAQNEESSPALGGRTPADPCVGAPRPRRRGGGGSGGEIRGHAGREKETARGGETRDRDGAGRAGEVWRQVRWGRRTSRSHG